MQNSIEYVVGAERGLKDVITEAEVMPLLKSAVLAGVLGAALTDAEAGPGWSIGAGFEKKEKTDENLPVAETEGHIITEITHVYLEGEPVGTITVKGGCDNEANIKGILSMLASAVNVMVNTNLKRMLTTEIHTRVVNQSYEELLETNRKLTVSEAKYRELAENLEMKVQERTEELKQAYARLLQSEKMASVGQLAAGVAHEINNPMGFIISNLNTMKKYTARFMEMLEYCRSTMNQVSGGTNNAFQKKSRELKLDFIFSDVGELLKQSLEGAERVKKIVADLKGFSHVDDAAETLIDINIEIDRTLSVLAREMPQGAEIVRDYRPLPGFICNPALLCQVFMNVILNACQAKRDGLRLVISSRCENNSIRLSFSDNGPGIPENIRNRIFEPFYTTKEVGQGTGMGLAVVYDIITGLNGIIELDCPAAGGSTFTIKLPTKRADHVEVF